MDSSNKLLSDITAFRTYAKYIPHATRRESLEESINRDMHMHLDKFPKLSSEIVKSFSFVHDLKVLPSMRGLQFAGEAVIKNNARQYNCSFTLIDNVRAFGEVLFLLLSGVGVGYSVQSVHIKQLPKIVLPNEEGYFKIHDSIQGWAQSVDVLVESYFFGRIRPVFDFTGIRAKGTPLITTGAKAPGPEPLKAMLAKLEKMLKLAAGRKLNSLEVHDIICIISDCVLAGGIRRAALISLFDRNDTDMLTCKSGTWWESAPWRARANNSAILPKNVSKEEFLYIFNACKESGAGEPGISWTNNPDMGFNPCHEVSLHNKQFCNLTTLNATGITTKKEFLKRVQAAATIATIQAAYTDFPYLTPEWTRVTSEEALLGVSMTGIADAADFFTEDILQEGAKLVLEVNERIAKKLGINLAARCTVIKPEGSSSCVLGSSSGIGDRHAALYLRRIRMSKADALSSYLKNVIPELVEDDFTNNSDIVVTIPQKSPEGSFLRENSSALGLLERAIKFNKNWVHPGHRYGDNMNNVSVTLSVKENEWDKLGQAMWTHRNSYTGISLLPYDGGSYKQLPFEECSQEIYDKYSKLVKNIDLKDVKENEDKTERQEVLACAGGICEI